MTSLQNVKFAKWQVDKMKGDKMASSQNQKLAIFQVVKTAS